MKEFKIKDQRGVEAWCMQFIGPRIFYLHDKIGGQGWCIKMSRKTYPTIIIEDDKHALMAMIKFGFEI
jgi:hypothetical protein